MKVSTIVIPILALAVLQCSRCSKSQAPAATNSENKINEGKLEGTVFLITNAGDLKPARFATVRLWRGFAPVTYVLIMDGPSFQTPVFQAQCRKNLLEDTRAQLKAAAGYKPEPLLLVGETDELGNFSFETLQPSSYTVDVIGHGGINAALWESTKVVVKGGENTKTKMGKPLHSCFDPDHVVPF